MHRKKVRDPFFVFPKTVSTQWCCLYLKSKSYDTEFIHIHILFFSLLHLLRLTLLAHLYPTYAPGLAVTGYLKIF